MPATYILPLRWQVDHGLADLAAYLETLSEWMPVIVVDGSPEPLFERHRDAFPAVVRHVSPLPRPGRNGKVAGVMTGVVLADTELLILADDDVRYESDALRRVLDLLDAADVVRPQNYFLTLPWHARWDTARTLINRAFHADYPGTLGVRRSTLLATDGYDGDVLFENLELLRTIKAAGGREHRAGEVFVGRLAPECRHFLRQRVRQAYDDLAQPGRLAAELALLPVLLLGASRTFHGRPGLLLAVAAAACATAEAGRCRLGGRLVFPRFSALWAPAWLLERAVCVWAALALRFMGGVPYAGSRLLRAATPQSRLNHRHSGSRNHRSAAGSFPAPTRRQPPQKAGTPYELQYSSAGAGDHPGVHRGLSERPLADPR